MIINKERAFDFLKKISFERLGGSVEELKAANYIIEECHKSNVEAVSEEFLVDNPVIKNAKLTILEPYTKEYLVTGYGMSGSTPLEGVIADFLYVEEGNEVNLLQTEGKIVMINGRMGYELYKKLIEAKVAGFISVSGSLFDDIKNTDLEERNLRERHYEHGKIPGVTLRINDAEEILIKGATKAKLVLLAEENKATSHNVIATIKGTTIPEEVIVFTAHYDSVRFSNGAYDNGTGTISIMELMHYFNENKPKRTLKFIWCGSEEMGLLGSKDYVKVHEEELKNIKFCLNVDMTAPVIGYDIAVCTAEMSLVNYIDYLGKEVGHPIKTSQGVYSSDSTPFADKGIPAVSFARLAPKGGAEIHSRRDDIEHLTVEVFLKTQKFITLFADKIVNAVLVPVPKTMPQNMIEKLGEYLGRKINKK